MDTKLKKTRSKVFKTFLVILYIAAFAAMGVVTGYVPAYYNVDYGTWLEAAVSDNFENSYLYYKEIYRYHDYIYDIIEWCSTDESGSEGYCRLRMAPNKVVSYLDDMNFYVCIRLSSGKEYKNSYIPANEPQDMIDSSSDKYDSLKVSEIKIAMSWERYNELKKDWEQIRFNTMIIVITDILLFAAGIVLMCVLCRISGEQPDGTVKLHPFFMLFYELAVAAFALSLIPFSIIIYAAIDPNGLVAKTDLGKIMLMLGYGGLCVVSALCLLYIIVSMSIRAKCKRFLSGSLVILILKITFGILKWCFGKLKRFGRGIIGIFTGELFKSGSAARINLIVDSVFIGSTAMNVLLLIMSQGYLSALCVIIELFLVGAYWYGRFRLLKDSAVLERQIRAIYDGDYGYKAQLSKNSPYEISSGKLSMLAEQFKRNIEESVKAERMKIDLVTNVSHDLKTPLTSIISYVELLSKEELTPECAEYVEILKQKSERLKNIVTDVFELAKTTSGEITVSRERLDLNKLSYQTLGEMEDKIAASGFDVRRDICLPPVTVVSDGQRIYRIIQNLMDNALKYSMQGTRIYYSLKKADGRAVITIKNIAAYEMDFTAEEMLERFARGDKSRSTEGSGLGLSIAQGFTLACGGKFGIEIDGDMFKATVSFPLCETAEDTVSKEIKEMVKEPDIPEKVTVNG